MRGTVPEGRNEGPKGSESHRNQGIDDPVGQISEIPREERALFSESLTCELTGAVGYDAVWGRMKWSPKRRHAPLLPVKRLVRPQRADICMWHKLLENTLPAPAEILRALAAPP